MDFYEMLDRVLILLHQHGRASYRALKRQFDVDDAYLEDLKNELLYTQSDVVEDGDRGLIWTRGSPDSAHGSHPETDGESPYHLVAGWIF